MASATVRCKGQEVSILIVANSGGGPQVQATLTETSNFNGELEFEVISKGYLGEKTNRKDMIYNGAKFDFEVNTYTADVWTLVATIKALAQRTAPNNQINISGVFEYPDGDVATMLWANCQFGALPVQVPGRNEYVKHKFQGETDDVIVTTN
jgi:hypothetical protein